MVRLETRPPNLEGEGEITMRDLVKNCLRMRPERIIVGEVRGPEAFDLLQAMNTGHDGSMGTLHANSPREAISRLESMIMMGGFPLPVQTIREMIIGSIDVIIQASRLRDGSRKVTHITEVLGMEGDVVTLQNLIVYRDHRRGRARQAPRTPPLDRHRAPALLGPGQYYKRGRTSGRGAGSRRGARHQRQPARRREWLRAHDSGIGWQRCWRRWRSRRWCSRSSYPHVLGGAQADERYKTRHREQSPQNAARPDRRARRQRRKKQVADTLKDLEERQKAAEKVTLRLRLQRAGLAIDPEGILDRKRRFSGCV